MKDGNTRGIEQPSNEVTIIDEGRQDKDIAYPNEHIVEGVVLTYINLPKSSKSRALVRNTITDLYGLPLLATDITDIKCRASDVMGKIKASDCVMLFYTSDISSISCHDCDSCYLSESFCQKQQPYKCKSFVEFELKYAISLQKKVVVFVDNNNICDENGSPKKDDPFLKLLLKLRSDYAGRVNIFYYQELNKEDIQASFVSVRDELISTGSGYFRPKDYCLSVLNKCVQRASVPQKTIGEYTNTSGEMKAKSGSEIHILTNEWRNYDYTTLSTLTIAMNTKRGVKYCYYAPEIYRNEVETFKELLKDYYSKTFKARQKVVAWIRMSKSEHFYLDDFLSAIAKKDIKDVLSSLLISSDNYSLETVQKLLDACTENGKPINLEVDRNRLNEWIHGKIINNDRTLLRFLRNIGIILTAINSEADLRKNSTIDGFCTKLELLYNMYRLLQWQTGRDDEETQQKFSDTEISEIINYFKYRDNDAQGSSNLIISDPFEDWLCDSGGNDIIGAIPENEENDVNKYLSNIIFLPIDESMPLELSYSFSLFLGYSPNGTKNESAAWYTTCSNNEDADYDKIDNALFMVDIDSNDELFGKVKEIFKRIISYNSEIKKILEENNSAILKWKGFDVL